MISICIPYIRPEKYKRASFLAKTNSSPVKVEIIAEEDHKRIGAPKMLKRLVERSQYDYICFLGDDTLPQPGYMQAAMEEIQSFEGGVGLVGLNDLTGRDLPTHWVGHKKLLDHLGGEFFHTGYHHLCSDLELWERTKAMGKYVMCKNAVVKHDHPFISGAESDKDYDFIYSDPIRSKDLALYEDRLLHGWK